MINSICIDKDVPIEMRDGVLLRADVYRPDDKERHPAILMRSPYGTDVVLNGDYPKVFPSVQSGYAVVIEHVRGRFTSGGKWEGSTQKVDGPDGYDTVEWIAGQPWSDGNVGTAGISYLGSVQWKLARENPPHLKAISPALCGAPGSEPGLWNGVLTLSQAVTVTVEMAFDVIDKLEKQGKDVSQMRRMVNQAGANPAEVCSYLPLKNAPHFNFPGLKELWLERLFVMLPDPSSDLNEPYPFHKVTVPGLYRSGWYDCFTRRTFSSFTNMRGKGGTPFARHNQHLFVGPWGHDNPARVLGGRDFGIFSDAAGAQSTHYHLSFFDKYLRGENIELPVVRYFLMGKNIWQDADDWPLPQTQWQRFYLHSKGKANTAGGNGTLSQNQPGSEPPDSFIYDPKNPVPSTGGRGVTGLGDICGPMDQIYVEKRPDVLCFTSSELKEDLEVTGPIDLHLFASTSCRDTDFVAKIIDVFPDERAFNVSDGIVRAQFRNSIFEPEPVSPGEIIEYIIPLGPTSQLFRKGHKIRIDVCSSNFPTYDRNMNTGNPVGEDAEGIPATQSVFHDQRYASYVDLPVIPGSK